MKQLIILVCAIASLTGLAQKKVDPKVKAAMERRRAAGYVVKPGSQKGVFAIVNTQKNLAKSEILAVAKTIEESLLIKVAVSEASAGDPKTLVAASGGALGVVVAFDDKTPSLLVAPDDGWAVVNIKKLDKFPTQSAREKFFTKRCRGQLIRAFSAVAGGFMSTYPGNMMDVVTLSDIEAAPEGIPHDKVQAAQRFLKARGYSPLIRAPYAKACREGWAPPPTNSVQKAIWDHVHTKPTKPMKIKFDPKKGE